MPKYKIGDVVIAPVSYFDNKEGYWKSQNRWFVIVKIDEDPDDIDSLNITVACTGQVHQSQKHPGIIIKENSRDGSEMQIEMDTFIYCDYVVKFMDNQIIRKKGYCPKIEDILKLVKL
jgi:hypothetical protein